MAGAPPVSAVILAGGRGRRMGGADKGLLPLAGRPMFAHALARLAPQVAEVMINANRSREAYQGWGCRVVADASGDFLGPLAGMLAALDAMAGEYLLTAPCDSPLIAPDYAARMLAGLADQGAELAVATDGERDQPVFLLLHRGLREDLAQALQQGERKIDRWYARHRCARVDLSDRAWQFRNVNTPAEMQALASELRGGGTAGASRGPSS